MTVRIVRGDCREVLRAMPEKSVHCCVTSPPYFGLRDYGTAKWGGGNPACEHRVGDRVPDNKAPGAIVSGVRPGVDASTCKVCGARRIDSQIGLEQTPNDYIEKLVEVFREVRRVLRDDGTLWLNLGDSYAGSWGAQGRQGASGQMADRAVAKIREKSAISEAQIKAHPHLACNTGSLSRTPGLKPKDLIGIPWRVAFALQADGWYLRQDIIWHKPNPMPESVRDRCTKAHEYIFLLAKSERYYYNAEAIAEAVSATTVSRLSQPRLEQQAGSARVPGKTNGNMKAVGSTETRNKRSVWTITTKPFNEAHFATFPPDLIEPCVLAGCPRGGVVLDPFGGAGTTALVADRTGRDAVLIELNPEYAALAERRVRGENPLFAEVTAA